MQTGSGEKQQFFFFSLNLSRTSSGNSPDQSIIDLDSGSRAARPALPSAHCAVSSDSTAFPTIWSDTCRFAALKDHLGMTVLTILQRNAGHLYLPTPTVAANRLQALSLHKYCFLGHTRFGGFCWSGNDYVLLSKPNQLFQFKQGFLNTLLFFFFSQHTSQSVQFKFIRD